MIEDREVHWYAIRVSYGRVLKFGAQLQELGAEYFIPMCIKKITKDSKTESVVVPAITNLCFVHSSKDWLDELFSKMGETRYVHFIWDKATQSPIIVPDKAMSDFIRISSVMSDEILYLKELAPKLRTGRKVRILEGPFKGVEGVIVRVRKSRRVMVELPGMLAVATTFIAPQNLELIEP